MFEAYQCGWIVRESVKIQDALSQLSQHDELEFLFALSIGGIASVLQNLQKSYKNPLLL